MHAGDPEEEQVGADPLCGLDGRGPARHGGVLEQLSADEEDVGGMIEQRGSDRRTVRDDRARQRERDLGDHRERRGAAVEDHGGARLDEGCGRGGDPRLAVRGHGRATPVVDHGGRCRKRTAVDAHRESRRIELAQIAADAVLRQAQLGGDVLRDEAAVTAQSFEQHVLARGSKHSESFRFVHVSAVLYPI